MDKTNNKIRIIGVIHSTYKEKKHAPPQGKKEIAKIEIFKKYEKGLKDIEGFSHLHVFCWFHKSKDYNLLITTPWDSRLHGLFTTRSPNRPNPIGHGIVELIKREGNFLKVKGSDAIDGTPILDIKPYIENIDSKSNTSKGWMEKQD